jgi:parvulin-like peptidyl-prolyl isomerase
MFRKAFKFLILFFIFHFSFSISCFSATLDKVIVVVNGETITQSELDAACEVMRQKLAAKFQGGELAREMEKGRKEVLDRMIEEKLILSAAKKKDIEVSDEEIEQKMRDVKSRFDSEERFQDTLRSEDLSVNELRNMYADQIRVSKMAEQVVKKKIEVTPSEIAEYYNFHKGEFRVPEQVRLKNILIKPDESLNDKEAAALAEKIVGFVKAGESFDELALKYSKGPNADMGGELGFMTKGQMLKEIERGVFNLKPGDVSEIIKTPLGYHIFKVEEKREEHIKELDEVKNDIEKILFIEKGKKQYDAWIKELKKDAYISYR